MSTRARPAAHSYLFAAAAAFIPALAANAVVTVGDGMERPDNGFVGRFRGASAVAVGEHWILTAAHVGANRSNTFRMNGATYGVESFVRHASADLMLVRLDGPLSGWHSVTGDARAGDRVLLAGVGYTDAAWSGERALAWGENVLTGANGALSMRFDANPRRALPHEAGFALYDSGGGVFVELADGSLALAGIASSVSHFGRTVDGSMSYAVGLDDYLDWIVQTTNGEAAIARIRSIPAPGAACLALVGALGGARRRR